MSVQEIDYESVSAEDVVITPEMAVKFADDPWAHHCFLLKGNWDPRVIARRLGEVLSSCDTDAVRAGLARKEQERAEAARVKAASERAKGERTDTQLLAEFVALQPRLSQRVRAVYDLCIRDGLSIRQCSERLKISPETVRSHLRRLRMLVPTELRKRHQPGPPCAERGA